MVVDVYQGSKKHQSSLSPEIYCVAERLCERPAGTMLDEGAALAAPPFTLELAGIC
jgi:hypothetical protein